MDLVAERTAAVLAATPLRDRAFAEYWTSRIDMANPAAPHWMAHFAERVAECGRMADRIGLHRAFDGARVLDVGCQTGALSAVMAERGAQVTGIDTTDWVLEAARRRVQGWGLHAEFQVARGESLPFADRSFDVVTFVDVIEHCEDSTACLREIARVLAPGGVAYVLGPNRFSPGWLMSDPHYQLFGASVLGPRLGKRYVEWRRGPTGYDIGVFPVGNLVARTLRRAGLEVIDSPVHEADRWFRDRAPASLARLRHFARAWGRFRFASMPTFTLLARRPD